MSWVCERVACACMCMRMGGERVGDGRVSAASWHQFYAKIFTQMPYKMAEHFVQLESCISNSVSFTRIERQQQTHGFQSKCVPNCFLSFFRSRFQGKKEKWGTRPHLCVHWIVQWNSMANFFIFKLFYCFRMSIRLDNKLMRRERKKILSL